MEHAPAHAPANPAKYYIPHGTQWPIIGSVALFCLMLGLASILNDWAGGWAFMPGAADPDLHVLRLVLAPSSMRTSAASTTWMSIARSAWA